MATAFTFIDLFAGIGGFRIGLEGLGGRCAYSLERDRFCRTTYGAWFGAEPEGRDIDDMEPSEVPPHHIMAAGFPCTSFSIAGVSARNALGKSHGFDCPVSGNLFFRLADALGACRPLAFIFENVKNLRSHDKGRTWETIRSTLDSLGYAVHASVLDAQDWGVPQHRERVLIVGFDRGAVPDPEFRFPRPASRRVALRDILEAGDPPRTVLSGRLWRHLRRHAARHAAKGNGFGYGMADLGGAARTLPARYYKDGKEILIPRGGGRNPRRLSPRECARLMGFPDRLPIVVSDTQAYRQFGNAVVPNVVRAVGRRVVAALRAAGRLA